MHIIFQEYRFRMYLWALLGFTLLVGVFSFVWYESLEAKKQQELEVIRPLTGELLGKTLKNVKVILQSHYIDSLHSEKNIVQESQNTFTWYHKGKKYMRFLPADVEGVRGAIDGLYSDVVIPQYSSEYLLRFSDKNVTNRLFMIRNALEAAKGYVVSEVNQDQFATQFTSVQKNNLIQKTYLLCDEGRILYAGDQHLIGEYVYTAFNKSYSFFHLEDFGNKLGVAGLRVVEGDDGNIYSVGWQSVQLGEQEYYVLNILQFTSTDAHVFSYLSKGQVSFLIVVLFGLFFFIFVPMGYVCIRERTLRERFLAIFEAMPCAVLVTDRDKKIIACNRAMETFLSCSRETILGKFPRQCAEFFPFKKEELFLVEIIDLPEDHFKKVSAHYEKFERTEEHLRATLDCTSPERYRKYEGIAQKLISAEAENLGYVEIITDISESSSLLDQIATSEAQYKRVIDITNQGIWEWDIKKDIFFLSPRSKAILGYKDDELVSSIDDWLRLVHPKDHELSMSYLQEVTQDSPHHETEYRALHRDGRYRWIQCRATGVWEEGELIQLVGSHRDISERKKNELIFEVLYKVSMASYLNQGIGRYLLAVYDAVKQYTGVENFYVALWRPEKNAFEFVFDRDETGPIDAVSLQIECADVTRIPGLSGHVIRRGKSCVFTEDVKEMEDCSGTKCRCWLGSPINLEGKTIGLLAVQDYHYVDTFTEEDFFLLEAVGEQIARAIEREQVHEHLFHQASHDNLTGLVNREYFLDLALRVINKQKRDGRFHALLMLDLNRFKQINDSLGHAVGDRVLIDVAQKIQSQLRSTDTLGRLGGDEFAILLEDSGQPRNVVQVVKRIIAEVKKGVDIYGRSVMTGVSVGAVLNIGRYTDVHKVLHDADLAMYEAKNKSSQHFRVFNQVLFSRVQHRIAVDYSLTNEFDPEEFSLVYQPVIDIQKGKIEGFEALVRWAPKSLGPLRPDQFLPVAEEIGVIAKIDALVLLMACRDLRKWRDNHPFFENLRVSVNISQYELIDLNLGKRILTCVRENGLDQEAIVIEVTETGLMENLNVGGLVLKELRSHGISVHIDDFGTGYSSLSHLADLPFDALKVDRSFLAQAHDSPQRLTVLETLVRMSDSLIIPAIAEGVETQEQLQLISDLGCRFAQGYLFSPPLPKDEVVEYCENFTFPVILQKKLS